MMKDIQNESHDESRHLDQSTNLINEDLDAAINLYALIPKTIKKHIIVVKIYSFFFHFVGNLYHSFKFVTKIIKCSTFLKISGQVLFLFFCPFIFINFISRTLRQK